MTARFGRPRPRVARSAEPLLAALSRQHASSFKRVVINMSKGTPTTTVRIPPEVKAELGEVCTDRGITVARALRIGAELMVAVLGGEIPVALVESGDRARAESLAASATALGFAGEPVKQSATGNGRWGALVQWAGPAPTAVQKQSGAAAPPDAAGKRSESV